MLAVWVVLAAGCNAGTGAARASPQPRGAAIRPVRVRIAPSAKQIRLRVDAGYVLVDANGQEPLPDGRLPDGRGSGWTTVAAPSAKTIRFGEDLLETDKIEIIPHVNGAVWLAILKNGRWSPPARYFGSLTVAARDERRLCVLNEVDIESYVACVVAREVWPGFHEEALRAQAVVARTYVLYRMQHRQDRPFDVSDDEASQVYTGIVGGRIAERAWSAAEYTRGIVCTILNPSPDRNGAGREGAVRRSSHRLFPTYYSAACGGVTQSEAAFGGTEPIQPLTGGIKCDYCRIAPGETYRWEPRSLPVAEVERRLQAGDGRLADLRRIVTIEVAARHASGRPLRLRLRDSAGAFYEMPVERFRGLVGSSVLPSTDCEILVEGQTVHFRGGKGFGHGVGLCQWGMQGQALLGRKAGEVLRHYYPGARLARAY